MKLRGSDSHSGFEKGKHSGCMRLMGSARGRHSGYMKLRGSDSHSGFEKEKHSGCMRLMGCMRLRDSARERENKPRGLD